MAAYLPHHLIEITHTPSLVPFKHHSKGGGGEKLKAKAKALEDAEKRQKDLGGGPSTLKWTV